MINFKISEMTRLWFGFVISDDQGIPYHVGVCKMGSLFSLKGVTVDLPDQITLEIIAQDVQKRVAASQVLEWVHANGCQKEVLPDPAALMKSYVRAGTPVKCNETGEQFRTMTEAARRKGVSKATMSLHISGADGYEKVKGLTYARV